MSENVYLVDESKINPKNIQLVVGKIKKIEREHNETLELYLLNMRIAEILLLYFFDRDNSSDIMAADGRDKTRFIKELCKLISEKDIWDGNIDPYFLKKVRWCLDIHNGIMKLAEIHNNLWYET